MNIDIMDKTINELENPSDELFHHGIKGMKWGVRRTPAQLGHKTAGKKKSSSKKSSKAKEYIDGLVKKHKEKRAEKKAENAARKAAKKAEDEERKADLKRQKTPISKMSDSELAEYILRKNAEKTAYTLERDINALNPPKVSAGKKFADKFGDKFANSLADAGNNLVKGLMDKTLKKVFGEGAEGPFAELEKEAKKAGFDSIIAKARKDEADADKAETQAAEKKYDFDRKKQGDEDADNAASRRADADEAARKANEERSRQEYEREGSGSYSYIPRSSDSKYYTGRRSSSDKVHVGELVEGSSKKGLPPGFSVKDTSMYDFANRPYSSAASSSNSSTRSLGQSYVSGYLSAPASSTSNSTRALGQSYIAGYLPAPKDDD